MKYMEEKFFSILGFLEIALLSSSPALSGPLFGLVLSLVSLFVYYHSKHLVPSA